MKKCNRTGFTINEILIYSGILAIFLIVMTHTFTSILSNQLQSESTSDVQQDTRFLFSRLSYDVLRSSTINTPASVGASGNTLVIVIAGVANTYSVNAGGNLQVVNGNGMDILNSFDTSISNLSFQRIGNVEGKNSIKMSFTITSRIRVNGVYESKNVVTTLGTR